MSVAAIASSEPVQAILLKLYGYVAAAAVRAAGRWLTCAAGASQAPSPSNSVVTTPASILARIKTSTVTSLRCRYQTRIASRPRSSNEDPARQNARPPAH